MTTTAFVALTHAFEKTADCFVQYRAVCFAASRPGHPDGHVEGPPVPDHVGVQVGRAIRGLRQDYLLATRGHFGRKIFAGRLERPPLFWRHVAGPRRVRDRKSTRLNSSHIPLSRMPSS